MKKRRLGKSGIVISEIGMGTMTFGSSCDEATSFKILDKAYDAQNKTKRFRFDCI